MVITMPRSQLTKVDILSKVLKLKDELHKEQQFNVHKKDTYDIAHRYLNEVLNFIEEYRY